MSRKRMIRIFNADGTFKEWATDARVGASIAMGELVAIFDQRPGHAGQISGYTWEVKHKDSPNISPASLTSADCLACVGLSRFEFGIISEGRRKAARAKRRAFGKQPKPASGGGKPWSYRGKQGGYGVTVVEVLPESPIAPF